VLFNYKARTKKGKLQSGTVEAANQTAALEVLRGNDLIVINLEPARPASFWTKDLEILARISDKDIVFFSRALSSLFDAGVPLVESIRALSEQTPSVKLAQVLEELASDVEGGMTFSKALAGHPKVFNQFYVAMVRSGEVSGNLQQVLAFLAEHLEKEANLKSKIRAALTYPAFVISVFFVVGIIMFAFVIPRLADVLQQMSTGTLPLPSRMLIALSDLSVQFLGLILVVLAGGLGALVYWLRTEQGQLWWDRWQLKLPIFGKLFQKVYQARFAQSLATLIEGGLPILEAINITSDVIGNSVYQSILSEVVEHVKGGGSIEAVLATKKEFNPLLVQMVAVGERSGKLGEVLKKVGSFFQSEVDAAVDNLASLIEPILIVVLGIGVGFLVAAVIIPIYSVITSIGG
jgi:type IV pilus assembly protein PilC